MYTIAFIREEKNEKMMMMMMMMIHIAQAAGTAS
jgi:hypothetical protein